MDQTIDSYIKAGKIAASVLKDIKNRIQPGMTFLEVCDLVEKRIKELGGDPAFPVNICVNDIAAHDTAEINDQRVIKDNDVVKLDVGVHVNGYIADTAITLTFSEKFSDIINANIEVLNLALQKVSTGESLNEIGRIIYYSALSRGYKPISNLSGHSLDYYKIHAGQSVPNVPINGLIGHFIAGKCYAIEPFLTDKKAAAFVKEDTRANIFSLIKRKKVKFEQADNLLEAIWLRRKTLPFAARWFTNMLEEKELLKILDFLIKNKLVRKYPVLKEATNQIVTQFEHTVLVLEKNSIITTLN
ncbi:MAG: type II methionyl aminopeptidase [Nitrososphaeria archaeon]